MTTQTPSQESQLLLKHVTMARQAILTSSLRTNTTTSRQPSTSALTAEPTPRPVQLKTDEILIEAFIAEAFMAPSDAIIAVQVAASHGLGAYASLHFLAQLQVDCDREGITSFLSSYLSAVSFKLVVEGYDPKVVFNAIAGVVVPYDVQEKGFLGSDAFYNERFALRGAAMSNLLNNPLLLCLVFLRLNMEKLMLTLNSLGEYRTAIQPSSSD